MNDYQMNNEFLKSVMEGMGVQPTDNMLDNWNTIMNFVPSSPGIGSNFGGDNIKLTFKEMTGGNPYEIEVPENMPLKDALYEFGKKANLSEDVINKCQFLCGGQIFSVKTNGTVKENKLKKDTPIVLVKDIE